MKYTRQDDMAGYHTTVGADIPERFTFPAFRSLLNHRDDATFVCAAQLGAPPQTTDATPTPVAAILGRISDDGKKAKLMSVLVDPPHRRRGLATRLILQFLEWAALQKADYAEVRYTNRSNSTAALEAVLGATGWSRPQETMTFAKADPNTLMKLDWIKQQSSCPPRLTEPVYWENLTTSDRASIKRQLDAGNAPSEVSPFWEEENIAADISLGLRRDGDIVGWMVCHTIPVLPHHIRYSRSFACPVRAGRGNGPWLMANAVKRHLASSYYEENPRIMFDLMSDNTPMVRLFEKRIKPAVDETYELRIRTIALR